jgi:hypothetical protein
VQPGAGVSPKVASFVAWAFTDRPGASKSAVPANNKKSDITPAFMPLYLPRPLCSSACRAPFAVDTFFLVADGIKQA